MHPLAAPHEGGGEEVTCERCCLPGEPVLKQSTAGEEFLKLQQGCAQLVHVLLSAGGCWWQCSNCVCSVKSPALSAGQLFLVQDDPQPAS